MTTNTNILHVQRRIFAVDDGGNTNVFRPVVTPDDNQLRSVLFQPIAGDSGNRMPVGLADCAVKAIQFGMLDPETIQRTSVALITNPSCSELPGCLMDLRMGASAISNKPCETCLGNHHNCLL